MTPLEADRGDIESGRKSVLIGCGLPTSGTMTPELVGFKAYNLWRMERAGLRVPPAFVLETGYCRDYVVAKGSAPQGLRELLMARVHDLERASGFVLGSARRPLLVSIRSGAPVSMPGMLDTVLDIGIGESTVSGLLRLTGNPRLVWDSYRRLIESFAEVVHGLGRARFESALAARLHEVGAASPLELDYQGLRALTRDYLDIFEEMAGSPFPQQPIDQLQAAVVAVWASWEQDKAVGYRRLNGIPDDMGTAATVQQMVFGNAGGTSGAGVAFTRDPGTGGHALYVDFMFNAQGEDVVSGRCRAPDGERLTVMLPQVYSELRGVAEHLEREFRDMQEFEFTVQDGTLYVLQTRAGKRTPWAAVQIAVDQVEEGLIGESEALERLASMDLKRVARLRVVRGDSTRVLGRGTSAGAGVAVGEIALDAERAQRIVDAGRSAVLVRESAVTEDIAGIAVSTGILTAAGNRTSHAAVVARQLNKVCIAGCDALVIDLERRRCSLTGEWLAEGTVITLDGHAGAVLLGAAEVEAEKPTDCLRKIAGWEAVARAAKGIEIPPSCNQSAICL